MTPRDKLMFAAAACAIALVQPARAQTWTLSGEAAIVSEYNARGVSLSDREPAVQGGVTLSHANGLHADLWASSIARSAKGARAEVNIGAGYSGSLGKSASFDAGIVYFLYPSDRELDFVELNAQVTRIVGSTSFTGAVAYAPKQKNMRAPSGRLRDNVYVSLEVQQPIAGTPFTLVAGSGYENGHFDGCVVGGKTDWLAGVTLDIKRVALGAYYVGSDAEIVSDAGRDLAGHGALLSATVSF